MNFAHLLEAAMLVCFGFSWPLNVMKAYKARTAKGTSLPFIILIITGYIAGISAKIINGQFNYVLVVYFLNLAIVMMNIFVYIRNVALDKKNVGSSNKIKTIDIKEEKEENMTNFSNSFDEYINRVDTSVENTNAVILMGTGTDNYIPVDLLAKDFGFNFDIYNKSAVSLSLSSANEYFNKNIATLQPEAVMLHLGENDTKLFKTDSKTFDNNYLALIENIKSLNKNCRIALVSVDNPYSDKTIKEMNAHIKAIAEAENAVYVNLENIMLWNPEATKVASDFAYTMGLSIRKPLLNVAEILYSYSFHNIKSRMTEPKVS